MVELRFFTSEVYHLDHEISGHVAPDDTTFLHPASDLDYTTYIFEKFSLRVEPHQIRFYGVPSRDDELWKQSTWPLQKQFDFMPLALTLPLTLRACGCMMMHVAANPHCTKLFDVS